MNKVIVPKQTPIFPTLSQQYNQQPMTNFVTAQDQPIIASQSSWSSPYGQSTTVNTDQSTQQQYGQLSNQQSQPLFTAQKPIFTFVPQQQKLRSFARVFQPELNKNQNIQSAYRR
jgi:hypothetical protein